MKAKKQVWCFFVVAFLLIALILIAIFWDSVHVFISPKTALSSALTQTKARLEDRIQGNPLLILAKNLEPEGKYIAKINADSTNELMGNVSYDMTVFTNVSSHQLLANGIVQTLDRDLDLSLYMDSDFMAISSEDLLNSSYYGITYDRFSEDIRNFPLLKFVIPESTIQDWEESVAGIQEKMNREYQIPQVPTISEEDIQSFLLALIAMPSRVTREELLLNGDTVRCHKITYQASGEKIGALLQTQNGTVAVSFYLCQDSVVKIDLNIAAGEEYLVAELTLGIDAQKDTLYLQAEYHKNGERNGLSASVATQRNENHYSEQWNIGHAGKNISFSYDMNTDTGDMLLTVNSGDPISLRLSETENGFRIETGDLLGLAHALFPDSKEAASGEKVTCSMSVTKGNDISIPVYKNMDQWSMEDLLVLLTGIGGLIGVRFA